MTSWQDPQPQKRRRLYEDNSTQANEALKQASQVPVAPLIPPSAFAEPALSHPEQDQAIPLARQDSAERPTVFPPSAVQTGAASQPPPRQESSGGVTDFLYKKTISSENAVKKPMTRRQLRAALNETTASSAKLSTPSPAVDSAAIHANAPQAPAQPGHFRPPVIEPVTRQPNVPFETLRPEEQLRSSSADGSDNQILNPRQSNTYLGSRTPEVSNVADVDFKQESNQVSGGDQSSRTAQQLPGASYQRVTSEPVEKDSQTQTSVWDRFNGQPFQRRQLPPQGPSSASVENIISDDVQIKSTRVGGRLPQEPQAQPVISKPSPMTSHGVPATEHLFAPASVEPQESVESDLSVSYGEGDTVVSVRGATPTSAPATTNALILPMLPEKEAFISPLSHTGEVLVTGSIDLPLGLGATGVNPAGLDSPDIDAMLEQAHPEESVSATAPVLAAQAVSASIPTRAVLAPPKRRSKVAPLTLMIIAGVLGLAVTGLLVYVLATNLFR